MVQKSKKTVQIPQIVSIDGLNIVYETLENAPKLNPLYMHLSQMIQARNSEYSGEQPDRDIGEREEEIMKQLIKRGTFRYPLLGIDSPIDKVGFLVSRFGSVYTAEFYIAADTFTFQGKSREFRKALTAYGDKYSFQQINEGFTGRVFENGKARFGIQGARGYRGIGIGCNGVPGLSFGDIKDFIAEIKGNDDTKRDSRLSLEDMGNIFLDVCYDRAPVDLKEPYHLVPGLA